MTGPATPKQCGKDEIRPRCSEMSFDWWRPHWVDGSATPSRWVGHPEWMGRLPRLNRSKNGYIEGPKFPHLVDRQREKFSLYPPNQIRSDNNVLYEECMKNVRRMYEECTKNVRRMYEECTKNVRRMYEECTKNVRRMLFRWTLSRIFKRNSSKHSKTRSSDMNYRWWNFYLFEIWDDELIDKIYIFLRVILHVK
jgi:hypothetical protein